jgi:hypothetical protein
MRRSMFMQARSGERVTSTLIPVQIAGLGDLDLQTFGRVLDISHLGLRLGVLDAVPVGAQLRIELEDSILIGEVRYCENQDSWFAIGLAIVPSPKVC